MREISRDYGRRRQLRCSALDWEKAACRRPPVAFLPKPPVPGPAFKLTCQATWRKKNLLHGLLPPHPSPAFLHRRGRAVFGEPSSCGSLSWTDEMATLVHTWSSAQREELGIRRFVWPAMITKWQQQKTIGICSNDPGPYGRVSFVGAGGR